MHCVLGPPDQMATAEVGIVQSSPGALHTDGPPGRIAETEVGAIWEDLGALKDS